MIRLFHRAGRLALLVVATGMLAACTPRTASDEKQRLYVSILPLRSLVEQIVGNDFTIEVLVPAGASPESFELSPKKYVALNRSVLIFNTGLMDFEQNLLRDFPDDRKLVNLSRGVRLLEGSCGHDHSGMDHGGDIGDTHGIDPHIWTSPRALKRMAANAYGAIHAQWPDSIRYTENYRKLAARIDSLDAACAEALQQAAVRSIVIYHPTLTYYAADYGLEQLAIERDGKEPSARHLAQLIETARNRGVGQIFYQAQYPVSSVKVIAEDIGAECIRIDPLREDVIENIGDITRQITDGK
ncbi:zinc ABC transporter substrate-binding protein [uncultured Alistipes sp.]|uniref:metal ABC transporter solute-binding protein, Zn/Mn family n=1 Tax=uncultured Alistipes sp. TaxID=538949 RepID=UPI002637B9D3|nr:zinc ABC transporter substrate-binding protein [uncultured Alistipes sp.]